MDLTKLLELQNGSDIRGIATEGISGEMININPLITKRIAQAYVIWLSKKTGKPVDKLSVSVGRDSRISGPALMESFIQGVIEIGASAIDCNIASTPAMYMSTVFESTCFDGAVMLTASHLPYNRNGIKFFTSEGGLNKPDITEILIIASTLKIVNSGQGTISVFDLIDLYSDFLVNKIKSEVNHPQNFDKPLSEFHIVVDAGNGSGGFYANKVLKKLGANIQGSQFLDPDGMFPNHVPNPEDTVAMRFIQNAVLKNSADLGIIFDTDVDRVAAVDHNGKSINRNNLIALISAIVLEEHPGTTIVTDSITSDGLNYFIEKKLGGYHHRFKRGYKNVINESIRLNNEGKPSWLAIETSGHAALKENFFLDDGAYLITKILIKAAQLKLEGKTNILDLITNLQEPLESEEFRCKIKVAEFQDFGNKLISDIKEHVSEIEGWQLVANNYEGVRVACNEFNGNGWFLIRLSLHDPIIPTNIESDSTGGVKIIAEKIYAFLKQYPLLDCSGLEKFLK